MTKLLVVDPVKRLTAKEVGSGVLSDLPVCFVVINPRVLSAIRVDLGFFFCFINFLHFTPPPQALAHPWIAGTVSEKPIDGFVAKMRSFNAKRRWKVGVDYLLIRMWKGEEGGGELEPGIDSSHLSLPFDILLPLCPYPSSKFRIFTKRLAWALFVLLFSTLVCCKPTEFFFFFFWGGGFIKFSILPPSPRLPDKPLSLSAVWLTSRTWVFQFPIPWGEEGVVSTGKTRNKRKRGESLSSAVNHIIILNNT